MSKATEITFGYVAGEQCWRNGCAGIIAERVVENCSCHIAPPCGACTTPREYCPVCDWQAKDEDEVTNGHVIKYADPAKGILASWKPRPLDPRKIDYRIKSDTHFTQVCEGVYPEGATQADVLAKVKGTFGGRFELFDGGKFRYVAYTD